MSKTPSSEAQSNQLGDFELNLLKQEYFFLQTTIEDYNKQIWVIKALGITGTSAVLGFILREKQNLSVSISASNIAFIGCAIPLFFWILESQWKHFQRGFYPRVAQIESILANTYGLCSPKIYGSWTYTFKRSPTSQHKGYLWDGLLNRSVCVSYLLEIAFLLIIAAIAYFWKR
ncbi:hypothetical protein ACSQ6I_18820 [Anabaena sp. WFMT]|uniref:hypothetical protein n=1 Tax=Anabaena sp. WFMT TaxID=3449730 RepID=UPI003F203451